MIRKQKIVILLKLSALFMISSTCLAGDLHWAGCGISKKAFMKEMAATYKAKTGVAIKLSGGGATKGIQAASAGTVDLGGGLSASSHNCDGRNQ